MTPKNIATINFSTRRNTFLSIVSADCLNSEMADIDSRNGSINGFHKL
jgi:hypothetical protein